MKLNAAAIAEALQEFGYTMVTGGTDNHLVLWDARSTGLSGSKIEKLLEMCEISVNKNSIVGDTSAVTPGGVRIGTPAATTRGMGETEMLVLAGFLHRAVVLGQLCQGSEAMGGSKKLKDFTAALEAHFAAEVTQLREDVESFASAFPLPGIVP